MSLLLRELLESALPADFLFRLFNWLLLGKSNSWQLAFFNIPVQLLMDWVIPCTLHRMLPVLIAEWQVAVGFQVIASSKVVLHGLPACMIDLVVFVHIYPKFLVWIISHTLVLLMKPIESPTHDIILRLWRCSIKLNPLTLLDQFKNIRSSSNTIWKTTSSIACQTQKSDNGRSVRLQLRMLSRLLIDLSVPLLYHRGNYWGCTITIIVDPWLFRVLVALRLLLTE